MSVLLAGVVAVLFACGFYLMLRRSLVKLLLGLALMGNATNLMIFTSAGLVRGKAPIVEGNAEIPTQPVADPLAQALILTAIVIGFGVLAYALALVQKTHQVTGTNDLNDLTTTDK